MTAPKNRWVYVTVWQSLNTATQQIHVNVFGYPTKNEALSWQRKARESLRDEPRRDIAVLADRVRPLIDDEYIAELNAAPSD